MAGTSPAQDTARRDWHALSTEAALAALDAAPAGLSGEEAARRRARFGPNRLPPPKPRPAWRRFAGQFRNVLVSLLLLAGSAAWLLGHPVDAVVIGLVVLANAVIGFVQEGRAEQAMRAIGAMVAQRARVRRDGRWQKLEAALLVPGDIVRLKPGDRVPADLRLLATHDLQADEAALTGESLPVAKRADALAADTPLAERAAMAWSGTLVVRGEGDGLVVGTGSATELGRITGLLAEVRSLVTPLLRQIDRFGRGLSVVIVGVASAMVLLAWGLHGQPPAQTFMAAVALAVAAIPEGLPAIITITLAVGVRRMAARRAIIRRLPAVETLGSVDTICSDKTGTLTCNQLQVTHLALDGALHGVDGWLGTDPARLHAVAESAALACEADHPEAADPLEAALLHWVAAQGVDAAALRARRARDGLLPFASEHKLMATRHGGQVFLKGAPERVLARCPAGRSSDIAADWQARIAEMAGQGLRVLALAERAARPGEEPLRMDALGEDFTLLALVGFADPPRPEVAAAIRACREAGIAVRMITGDHADTALAIAAEVGIDTAGGVLEGADLDALDPAALARRAAGVHVFARTSPENKLRLVEALQADGHVVAMTGDGVNDAPALKRADIGVAMGGKGTEAAREAADMVLADDHFATIVSGVEEGRGVYDNIRKTLLFALPTNAAEAMVILLAVLLGVALPITPVQVLWVNTVTAITLALALAFEPLEGDVMARPPRSSGQGLMAGLVVARVLWVGAAMTAGTFGLYLAALALGAGEAEARTVALNTLVMGELVYLFNARRWLEPSWRAAVLVANPWALWAAGGLLVLQVAVSYLPSAQRVLGTADISLLAWLWIAGFGVALFALVEMEKAILRRRP